MRRFSSMEWVPWGLIMSVHLFLVELYIIRVTFDHISGLLKVFSAFLVNQSDRHIALKLGSVTLSFQIPNNNSGSNLTSIPILHWLTINFIMCEAQSWISRFPWHHDRWWLNSGWKLARTQWTGQIILNCCIFWILVPLINLYAFVRRFFLTLKRERRSKEQWTNGVTTLDVRGGLSSAN